MWFSRGARDSRDIIDMNELYNTIENSRNARSLVQCDRITGLSDGLIIWTVDSAVACLVYCMSLSAMAKAELEARFWWWVAPNA